MAGRSAANTKQNPKTEALLEVGMQLMLQKGYTNTGLQEILQALNVSKSCFYHYFGSKENFAVEIIHHFDDTYAKTVYGALSDEDSTPLQRLRNYCEAGRQKLLSHECKYGCLIGNLSQEMSDQSEVLRVELASVLNRWRDRIAECIEAGQKQREISARRSPHELADVFMSGWNGALMRAKATKSTEPVDLFIQLMFEDILSP